MTNILTRVVRKFNQVFGKPVQQKTFEGWAQKNYNASPLVSFVIQCHNKTDSVIRMIRKLSAYPNAEILVIDDGSKVEEVPRLASALTGVNHFLIRSNDLYEIIMYDRAIYMSRGTYVVLLQDDDDFDTLNWVHEATEYFKNHPDLAILGGRNGGTLLPFETTPGGEIGEFTMDGEIGQRKNLEKFDLLGTMNGTATQFQFVHFVNRAPAILHRGHFLSKLIHIDQSLAPFQYDDTELCLRAWTVGLRVAWFPANFKTGVFNSGMGTWNRDFLVTQTKKNAKKVYDAYGALLSKIDALVETANRSIK